MALPRAAGTRAVPAISYRVFLFIAVVLLMVALLVHTNYVIDRLEDETQNLCHVLARFLAVSTFQAVEDPSVRAIFQDVLRNINFPIVLTDPQGIPRAWKNIGVEAHELGPVLGPPWKERYGTAVEHAVEPGMVFAVEPAAYVDLPECGGVVQVGIEEDVIVTAEGPRLVGTPQTELILLPASA